MQVPDDLDDQLEAARRALRKAVSRSHPGTRGPERFRMAVLTSCLNHGLRLGTDTELYCGSVLVNTVEQDLIDHGVRWGLKPLVERLAEEPRWFRVLNHPTRGSQEVLPWLHDLIADKHAYEVQDILDSIPKLSRSDAPPGIASEACAGGLSPWEHAPREEVEDGHPFRPQEHLRKLPRNANVIPCKFFRRGFCQDGESCPFMHEESGEGPSSLPRNAHLIPCKFFNRGYCQDGEVCPFLHEERWWHNIDEAGPINAREPAKRGPGPVRDAEPAGALQCMHCLQRGDRQRGRRAASAESRAGRHKLVQGGSWEELDAGGIAAVRPRAVPETSREVKEARSALQTAAGAVWQGESPAFVLKRALAFACLQYGFQGSSQLGWAFQQVPVPAERVQQHVGSVSAQTDIGHQELSKLMEQPRLGLKEVFEMVQAEDGAGWAVLPRFERLILERSSQVEQILAVTAVHHPVLGQLPALDVAERQAQRAADKGPAGVGEKAAKGAAAAKERVGKAMLVDNPKAAKEAYAQIVKSKRVAMTVEGPDGSGGEGTFRLVQVRTANMCYIFDVEAPSGQGRKVANTLKTLCEDDSIVKVMHRSTLVAEALQSQHTIQLEGIFDTLVAHDILQHLENMGAAKQSRHKQLSYNNLLRQFQLRVTKPKHVCEKIAQHEASPPGAADPCAS
eukprot:jgi/Astpho2/4617/Aster-00192